MSMVLRVPAPSSSVTSKVVSPGFAPTTRRVDVRPDAVVQLQLEVGVERGDD